MAERKGTKWQTIIYKTLHRKIKFQYIFVNFNQAMGCCYCWYIFIIFRVVVGACIGGLIGLGLFVTCIYFVCCKRKYNIFVCLKDIIEVGQLWPWPYDMLDLQLPVQPVSITTQPVSSNPVNGEVYSIQHYVIKFVSYLRQVGGVFRFPQSIQLTATI